MSVSDDDGLWLRREIPFEQDAPGCKLYSDVARLIVGGRLAVEGIELSRTLDPFDESLESVGPEQR